MSGEAFGAMLRRLRQERGLSQRQMAAASFTSQSHLVHIERGRTKHFTRDVVCAFASGLHLDEATTDRLLIAAGFWPWRMSEQTIGAVVRSVRDAFAEAAEPIDIRRAAG